MLREKIGDERFIRYLIRMFKAGVVAEGELTVSDEGGTARQYLQPYPVECVRALCHRHLV